MIGQSVDFKRYLRFLFITLSLVLQGPVLPFFILTQNVQPSYFILQQIIIYLFVILELIDFALFSYTYTKPKTPQILFIIRIILYLTLLGFFLGKGRQPKNIYRILHTIMGALIFNSLDCFSYKKSLVVTLILDFLTLLFFYYLKLGSSFFTPLNLRTAPFILTQIAVPLVFYIFAYLWNKDRQYERDNIKLLRELHKSHDTLEQFAKKISEEVSKEERLRIAREIHDSLGHSLAALKIQLNLAQKLWDKDTPKAKEALDISYDLSNEAMDEVRGSLKLLHEVKPFHLIPEVNQLINKSKQKGLSIDLNLVGDTLGFSENILRSAYRVIQEGITNAIKHSHTNIIVINITFDLDSLSVEIEDRGIGFTNREKQSQGHYGLKGLYHRVNLLGGEFVVDSTLGKGTTLKCKLPKENYEKD